MAGVSGPHIAGRPLRRGPIVSKISGCSPCGKACESMKFSTAFWLRTAPSFLKHFGDRVRHFSYAGTAFGLRSSGILVTPSVANGYRFNGMRAAPVGACMKPRDKTTCSRQRETVEKVAPNSSQTRCYAAGENCLRDLSQELYCANC